MRELPIPRGWWRSGSEASATYGVLQRTYRFTGFAAAISFMTKAASVAASFGHYPFWTNSRGTVEVCLTTGGRITYLDLRLATEMEELWEAETR